MSKRAVLYRMVTDQHICPFGLRAKDLLERKGYEVEDHLIKSREQQDAFKAQHDVKTTPQVFIDDERIGGYDELRSYFGMGKAGQSNRYTPVIAIFSVALVLAATVVYPAQIWSAETLMLFIGFSMVFLAIQKLQDLHSFTTMFITYDLLAMRQLRYAYVYPFIEAWAGIGMIAGVSAWLVAPFSLFIGLIGAASVYKAVYIDKRKLKCACVGGNSDVPLGFVSLTENLFMIIGALMMIFM